MLTDIPPQAQTVEEVDPNSFRHGVGDNLLRLTVAAGWAEFSRTFLIQRTVEVP